MDNPTLQTDAFPRLKTYLAGLPLGLNSFANVRTRAHFSNILRTKLAPVLGQGALPMGVRGALTKAYADEDWMPCAVYCALASLARDTIWQDSEAYHNGMFDVAKAMYGSAFHKALFFVLSPSLVVMGAAKRWDSVYQNTKFKVEKQSKTSAHLSLQAPANLFDTWGARSVGAGFCAAVSVSGAKNARCTEIIGGDGGVLFELTWDP